MLRIGRWNEAASAGKIEMRVGVDETGDEGDVAEIDICGALTG